MRSIICILFLCFYSSLSFAQKEIKYAVVCDNDWWKVIDEHDHVLVDSLAQRNTTSINQYSLRITEGVFPFKRDGHYGCKNYKGKIIIPNKYIVLRVVKYGCVRASLGGREYIFNAKGKLIASSEDYTYIADPDENGLLVVLKHNLIGAIDTRGRTVIPCSRYYHEREYWSEPKFENGLLRVLVRGHDSLNTSSHAAFYNYNIGFLDTRGNVVIPPVYPLRSCLQRPPPPDLRGVCGTGMLMLSRMGNTHRDERMVLSHDYYRFDGGICLVRRDDQNVVIDTKGDSLFTVNSHAKIIVKGGHVLLEPSGGPIMRILAPTAFIILDRTGKQIFSSDAETSLQGVESGVFMLILERHVPESGGMRYFYYKMVNPENPALAADSFGWADWFIGDYGQLLPFGLEEEDSNWVFVDKNGRYLPLKEKGIDYIRDFGDKELVMAHTFGDERGYTDRNFNWVIKPQFQRVDVFSEGMAAVMKDNKWGYINKKGEMMIPLKYDEATPFQALKIK